MYCANCGYEVDEDSAFCDACGTKLKENGEYLEGRVSESPVESPRGIRGGKSINGVAIFFISLLGASAFIFAGQMIAQSVGSAVRSSSSNYNVTYDNTADNTYDNTVDDTYDDTVDNSLSYSDGTYSDDSYAEDADSTAGSEDNAIHVSTAEDLSAMADNLSGYYVLDNDIDLSEYGDWVPIGDEDQPFTGFLNGNFHTIKGLNVQADVYSGYDGGLFGCLNGAFVNELVVENATIDVQAHGDEDLFANAGIIAGHASNASVSHCYVSGSVYVYGDGYLYARAGGIIGAAEQSCDISSCIVSGALIASGGNLRNSMAGGICAWLAGNEEYGYASAYQNFCMADISADASSDDGDGYSYAGGIVASGENYYLVDNVVLSENITSTAIAAAISPYGEQSDNCVAELLQVRASEVTDNEATTLTEGEVTDQETYSGKLGWVDDYYNTTQSEFLGQMIEMYQNR